MKKYRPNVAALMVDERGRLLVCERLGVPGAWQFPQGGVDEGEGWEEALKREVWEEIGVEPEEYQVEKEKGGYRYDYPPGVKKGKKSQYAGQEQMYYLCRMKGESPEVDVTREPREFAQYKWIKPEEFRSEWLPDFKVEVYRAVLKDFFGASLDG